MILGVRPPQPVCGVRRLFQRLPARSVIGAGRNHAVGAQRHAGGAKVVGEVEVGRVLLNIRKFVRAGVHVFAVDRAIAIVLGEDIPVGSAQVKYGSYPKLWEWLSTGSEKLTSRERLSTRRRPSSQRRPRAGTPAW